ncbi:MAG: DNA repair protein RecN [Oscillospiraceae bacterium]|nr:DNA repair protein RecN [Oscillospiraceae bacterium]
MIKLLHIENVAVIEEADITFSEGLNVLTGETGAGKSIVIDSLSAATGNRTSKEIIRTGADFASVTAVFSGNSDNTTDSSNIALNTWLEENGIESDDSGEVFLARRISSDGKSVCRINGTPVPAGVLRELGATLLDIHGQNDGRKLLDEGAHLTYLDIFGGHDSEIAQYKEAYTKLKNKKTEIKKLTMDEEEKEFRIERLKQSISEIEQANLNLGEQEDISSRRELLLNSSKLTESLEIAFEALYGGDDSTGVVALISDAQTQLDRAATYSEDLRLLSERLNDMGYTAQDIADELRDFKAQLDFSPGELEELEARLDVLKRITRKYGSEEEAIEYLEVAKDELSEIEDSSGRLAKYEKELMKFFDEAKKLSTALTKSRESAAKKLQKQVEDELAQLNMKGVQFKVEFGVVDGDDGLNATGGDNVWYLMSANAGEAPGRINKIASGGELARIMLALKNVLSSKFDTASMVFDEVDTGVSGIAAQRVGEKLAELAKARQVLCVTHLPQIAVMADTHFVISKSVSDGRTYTQVTELDIEGRKNELARLSSGENITATALSSAEENLAAAKKFKSSM